MQGFAQEEPMYQSASVLVMCADTGDVLYENEGYTRRYPASITKIMTALLVLEYVEDLNESITFSRRAVSIPYYASRVGMLEGESITVMQALYGLMLSSGNEIAWALAEHVSDSIPEFVNLMNMRAWELGAFSTRFVNPCGLPGDGQFVTAYDMALIMQAAIQHPVFLNIISTAFYAIPRTALYDKPRGLVNTNRMIRRGRAEFDPFVVGGKTGFTNAAQHTLVSYARNDNHGLIISVLYASPGITFTDTTALIRHVFEMLEAQEAEIIEPDAIFAYGHEEYEEYEEVEEVVEDTAETILGPAPPLIYSISFQDSANGPSGADIFILTTVVIIGVLILVLIIMLIKWNRS